MKSDSITNLSTALIKAQNEFDVIPKAVQAFKYKYAPLEVVYKATRKGLLNNGLCIIQSVNINENNDEVLITILSHSSGEYISSTVNIDSKIRVIREQLKTSNVNHDWGSTLTYARRYSYCTILGIIAEDEDHDGNDISPKLQNGNHKDKKQDVPSQLESPSAKLLHLVKGKGCDVIEFAKFHGIKSNDLSSVENAINNIDKMIGEFKSRDEIVVDEKRNEIS